MIKVCLSVILCVPIFAGAQSVNLDLAETILAHQKINGGWEKSYDRKKVASKKERQKAHSKRKEIDLTTIDNGATHREIRYLAKAYRKTKDKRYSEAIDLGVNYLLDAQYENGGWPQFFPKAKGYKKHITFNDGAMIGVMSLFRDIVNRPDYYSFINDDQRNACERAIANDLLP